MATTSILSADDLTWDSASCVAKIAFGVHDFAFTNFEPADVTIKTDKPRTLGQMLATKRTPGVAEVSTIKASMLLTDWQTLLRHANKHGLTLAQFQVTATIKHPTIGGSHRMLFSDSRITVLKGPKMDGSEKGLMKELEVDPMNVYERGADGIWKSLAYDERKPSSAAKLLMRF